jgi:hypothetical protein
MTEETQAASFDLLVWALYQTGFVEGSVGLDAAMIEAGKLLDFLAEDSDKKMQVYEMVSGSAVGQSMTTRIEQATALYEAINKRLEAE